MVMVVEFAFEAVQYVIDAGESGGFEFLGGIDRAIAAPADQHDRSVVGMAGEFFHFPGEMGVDLPVGTVVPGNVQCPGRMADEQELHFAAAVDE